MAGPDRPRPDAAPRRDGGDAQSAAGAAGGRNPADGAEQEDLSTAAGQERVQTGFWTPAFKSDEDDVGFDAAYQSWRSTHGERHDGDYRRWRAETGQPFSKAFLAWLEERRGGD
jgi:hypothetical protein